MDNWKYALIASVVTVFGMAIIALLSRFRLWKVSLSIFLVSSIGYKVDPKTLPVGLGIFQRGSDPKHFEILPTPGTFLTPEQYMYLYSQMKCVR